MRTKNEIPLRGVIELRNGANSGQFTQLPKDATECYRGLFYGFFLAIPDEYPRHFLDVIKPHLTYANFVEGKPLTVKAAIGAKQWMALPATDKKILANCKLTKAGEAHITLLPRE
jgi:hypothetical protein